MDTGTQLLNQFLNSPEVQGIILLIALAILGSVLIIVRFINRSFSDAIKKAREYDELTKQRVTSLEEESKKRSELIESQKQEIAANRLQISDLKDEIHRLVVERTDQVATLKGQYAALSDRLKDYENQNVQLRAQIVSLERENKLLRETIDQLRKQIDILNVGAAKHTQERDDYNNKLSIMNTELDRRNTQISEMQAQIAQLNVFAIPAEKAQPAKPGTGPLSTPKVDTSPLTLPSKDN